MPIHLSTAQSDFETRFAALLAMKREDAADVNDAVAAIIGDVRARGDAALVDLTSRFDRLALTPGTLAFSRDEIAGQTAKVAPEDRAALTMAAGRIRAYHARQMPDDMRWTDPEGAKLWAGAGRRFRPPGCMCRVGRPAIRPRS